MSSDDRRTFMIEPIESALLEDEIQAWREFNSTPRSTPVAETLASELVRVATANPDLSAVVLGGDVLKYQELLRMATACGVLLRQHGLQPGGLLGVIAERSIETYVVIYAAALAGLTYVPVGPEIDEHAVAALANASVQWVVGSQVGLGAILDVNPEMATVDIANLLAAAQRGPVHDEPHAFDDTGSLYVVHTSGTTGKPKGVSVSRASAANLARWYIDRHAVVPGDRLSANAPLTFDPSVQQIFSAWLAGASVHVVPQSVRADPNEFLTWLSESRITHLDIATAHWTHLCAALGRQSHLPSLRWAIVAGEAMYIAQCEQWFHKLGAGCRLHNIYGPTETTVNATQFEVTPQAVDLIAADGAMLPIGRPLPGYRVYVLDFRDELCPPGVDGEIVIAGKGLALGYVNDPGLTSARFTEINIAGHGREIVYRTGDIGHLRHVEDLGWVLQFRARLDRQIKVSGHRVDLATVETAARSAKGVDHLALVPQGAPAERIACVFSGSASPDEVRAHLDRELPANVPIGKVIEVPALPISRSGKLDYRALATIVEKNRAQPTVGASLPTGSVETQISRVFAVELDARDVTADSRFREIGGTSLSAFRLVTVLGDLGLDVRAADLMADLTVRECAERALARRSYGVPQVRTHEHIPWSSSRDKLLARVSAVWETDGMPPSGPVPVGPMTRAWLTRPRSPAPTACLELAFDDSFDASLVATALEDMIDAHRALRARWLPLVGASGYELSAEAVGGGVPLISVPPAPGGDLGLLRQIVAESAAFSRGRSRAVVASCDTATHAILYLPHALVDGASLALMTSELVDRVRGRRPQQSSNELLAMEDFLAQLRSVDGPQTAAVRQRWYDFEQQDALLADALSSGATQRVQTITIHAPRSTTEPHRRICALAVRSMAQILGWHRVPVSVLRRPRHHLYRGLALPVGNMLDAVPLLIDGTNPQDVTRNIAEEFASAVDAGPSHWVLQALTGVSTVSSRWAHAGLPLTGVVRLQGLHRQPPMPCGVSIVEADTSAFDSSPWLEFGVDGSSSLMRITVANVNDGFCNELRQLIPRLAAGS